MVSKNSNNQYLKWLKDDYESAIKEWRKNYKTLNNRDWAQANEIIMQNAGKKPWDRAPNTYEVEIINELSHIKPHMPILDAGCGVGYILYQFSQRGHTNLWGVDYSKTCIDECLKRLKGGKFRFYLDVMNIEGTAFDDLDFSGIVCSEVLEHVKNPLKIINELYRITKDRGKVVITVPYMNRRDSFTHINYFTIGSEVPRIKTTKEFNFYSMESLMKESKFEMFNVYLKRNKFIIVIGEKHAVL